MKLKISIDRGYSSEITEDTDCNNVVIKFDSVSVKRMHELTLEEARTVYTDLLKNLTKCSSGRAKASRLLRKSRAPSARR